MTLEQCPLHWQKPTLSQEWEMIMHFGNTIDVRLVELTEDTNSIRHHLASTGLAVSIGIDWLCTRIQEALQRVLLEERTRTPEWETSAAELLLGVRERDEVDHALGVAWWGLLSQIKGSQY